MERLQSAIAKARAAREGRGDVPESSDPSPKTVSARSSGAADAGGRATGAPIAATEAHPADADAVSALWDALPDAQISEKVLINHRILSTVGRSGESMEFDRLRTRILQRMQANGWKSLAITSPGPGCGKSTISLNLAFGLARQEGARVMLLELDMRRPSISKIIGVKHKADFSKVLAGVEKTEDHLVRARDNLAIGMSKSIADSAELLQAPTTRAVLDDMQARYQPSILIYDMPPFRISDDVISFVGKVDCVLIIASAGQTSLDDLDECERELSAQTNGLGVVLNKCRYQDQDDHYYYDS